LIDLVLAAPGNKVYIVYVEPDTILAMVAGPRRTAALAAWVQGLYPAGEEPVLVGGAAVELYTGGAYTTGDVDLVGHVPAAVARGLTSAGFRRRGRHWIHEAGQVFLEFPSAALREGETVVRIRVGSVEVSVVSPEDALVDRLAAWQHWRSAIDGVNAYLLFAAQRRALNTRRLRARAAAMDAQPALAALRRFARRKNQKRVRQENLERWAQQSP